MLSEKVYETKLNLDFDDRRILSLCRINAEITQDEISRTIKKVQPAVSKRIIKLEQHSMLVPQYGFDLGYFRVPLSIARISTRNSRRSLENLEKCDCVLNAFAHTGNSSVTAIVVGNHIKKIEDAIGHCHALISDVRQISISPVISPLKQDIFPLHPSLVTDYIQGNSSSTNSIRIYLPAIDDLDRRILSILQKDPRITQGKIAQMIMRSQATVSTRMINLHRKRLLVLNKGVNYKNTQTLRLVQVEISSSNVIPVLRRLSQCSAVPLGYHVENNASIIAFFTGPSLADIFEIIDDKILCDEHVRDIETHPVLGYTRDLILEFFNLYLF